MIGDTGRDELEQQVRRRVEMAFLHVIPSGLEGLRCCSRIARREVARRIRFHRDEIGLGGLPVLAAGLRLRRPGFVRLRLHRLGRDRLRRSGLFG